MRAWLQSWALGMAGLLFGAMPACAVSRQVQVCVHDERGVAIAGAQVQLSGEQSQTSDAGGCATVNVNTQEFVNISKDGFSPVVQALGSEGQEPLTLPTISHQACSSGASG